MRATRPPQISVPSTNVVPLAVIAAPSTDAERTAFVKAMARAGVELGMRGSYSTTTIAEERRPGERAATHERVTLARAEARAVAGSNPVLGVVVERHDDAAPSKHEPWYQVTVWVCGSAEIVCCRSALTPMQFAERVYIDGLVVELTDGGVDSFDPASISRVRIEVHLSKPPHDLRTVAFKAKRGARS